MTATTGTLYWLPRILGDSNLDATSTLIMIGLADHVDADDECFVGIQALADYARCSYGTARRKLAALEASGYLTRARRRRDDGNLSTYQWRLARLEPARNMRDDQRAPRSAMTSAHQDARTEVPSEELPSSETPASDDAGAVVTNLFGDDPASKPPKDPTDAMAERIAKAVCDKKRPKPAGRNAYLGVRSVAVALLQAGHEPRAIFDAMMAPGPVTIPAMELRISRDVQPPPGAESRQQVRER